ncbi:MAG TPA: hypothetical protein VKB39_12130 [Candidatus Baltobacteraceae bacterium]|nr:hypothetical protein [Candidatus Baltobacteraceae bacterium]
MSCRCFKATRTHANEPSDPAIYLTHLIAFGLIIGAIVDKNR